MAPALLFLTIACGLNAFFVERHQKQQFLEMKQIDVLQKDLKKVLQVLPEGVMIYKRFGNPHIKLWNNELERLFKFKSLPRSNSVVEETNADGATKSVKKIQNVDDLDQSHLKDIMSQKILKPI